MKKFILYTFMILLFFHYQNILQAQNIVVDSLLVLVPQNLDTTGFRGYLDNIKDEWENETFRYGTPAMSNVKLHWEIKILKVDSYFSYYQDRDSLHVIDSTKAYAHPWTYVTYVTEANDRQSYTGYLSNNQFFGFWRLSIIDGREKYFASHEMAHAFIYAVDYISNPLRIWDPIVDPDQTHLKRSLMSYGPYPTIPYLSPAHIDSTLKYYIPRGGRVSMDALISPVIPEMNQSLNIEDSLEFCWEPIYAAKRYNISLFEEEIPEAIVDTTLPAYFFDEVERLITLNRCLKISATVLKPNTSYKWKVVGENDHVIGSHQNWFTFAVAQITNVESLSNIPSDFYLSQNYPNPFNPSTIIKYSIPRSGIVQVRVYDALGGFVEMLVNKFQNSGNYEVEFNSNNLSSGIYFYELSTKDYRVVKKMTLLR